MISLGWSVMVQIAGAFLYAPWGWNARLLDAHGVRADVDRPPYHHRLWSFSDWQIPFLPANAEAARTERRIGLVKWSKWPKPS
jgi:hypothetical protein